MVGKNILVGYWPKEVVAGLENGAETLAWGGLGTVSSKGGFGPPIGSGYRPDGYYDHAAYFRNVAYMIGNVTQPQSPLDDANITEDISSKCYGIENDKNTPTNWGYRFTFGGPGGC